jgi:hypothetical protein
MARWMVQFPGTPPSGPVDAAELRAKWGRREIPQGTSVCAEGFSQWVAFHTVGELVGPTRAAPNQKGLLLGVAGLGVLLLLGVAVAVFVLHGRPSDRDVMDAMLNKGDDDWISDACGTRSDVTITSVEIMERGEYQHVLAYEAWPLRVHATGTCHPKDKSVDSKPFAAAPLTLVLGKDTWGKWYVRGRH